MSGLAGEIRSCTASEQFDLGGYTEQRAAELVRAAFATPLSAPSHMVRFTFVVGGGRLVRARYDDDLSRWLCAALREVGFSEDKSAAETFDSQGTFKQQHDTGQNLKFLIVYPRVECAERKAEGGAPAEVLDSSSTEYVIRASALDLFKSAVNAKTQSWRQKRAVLKVLQEGVEEFARIEAKLVSGSVLTALEQTVYDANSGEDDAKTAWLQGEIKALADAGTLSASEKKELLETMAGTLASLEEELSRAREEGAPRKVEKLEERRAAVAARKGVVEKAAPVVHRLKRGEDVRKLRLRLLPLHALEEKGRSVGLTMADLKTLEEKSELEAAVQALEQASRGWFVSDEEFSAMCRVEEEEAGRRYKEQVKAQAAKTAKSKGATSNAGWSSVGVKKAGSGTMAKASGGGKGSSFAAAFADDSD